MDRERVIRAYVTQEGDPLWPAFRSVNAGLDLVEAGGFAGPPDPALRSLAFSGTTSGEAMLRGEGFVAPHSPQGLMVMLPETTFEEQAGPAPWENHYLVLDGPLAEACVVACGRSATALSIRPAPVEVLHALLESCRLVVEQPDGWQWACLRHVTAVLDYTQEQLSATPDLPSLAAEAQALMARHLSTPLSLADLARRLGVSPSTLSHRFQEETGLPPAQAYRRMRLALARQFLANGFSVTETSRRLGFANAFHFSRLFRQAEGIAPRDFARQYAGVALRKY